VKVASPAAAFLAVLLSPLGFAQQEPSMDDLLDLPIEELLKVEITGPTRTSKNLQNVPASVTVFRRSELQKMGVDFLYELLSYVPGYQTSRDNDYGASYFYSSRGSDTGQDTTAILLLIDGAPQKISNGSASELTGLMPIVRIERIEVIRGPGSALYGSGAFLGAINIITVKGNNAVRAQAGRWDSHGLQGEFTARSGDWQFDTFLSGYEDHGQSYWLDDKLRSTPTQTSDPQSIENYTFRLAYRNTVARVEHVNIESEDFYSGSVINNDLNEQRNYLNFASIEQGLQWLSVSSTLRLSYSGNNLDYTAQGSRATDLARVSNPSSDAPLVGNVLYRSHHWLLQSLNDWRINASSSLQFGLEWQHEELDVARVLANYDTGMLANRQFPVTYSADGNIYNSVIETGDRAVAGAYVQLQNSLNAKTDITLGARYDNYENFDEQSSLRFSVIRKLTEHHSIKLFYGEAYRAPSIVQTNVKESLAVTRNPDLKAESIRTTELAWVTQQSAFSFSVGAFSNEIDDGIDSSGFIDGKRSTVNVDRVYSNGVELEASVQLNQRWMLRAGYTDFLKLPGSADRLSKHLASLILNYQREQWWANLSGYYNSQREMPVESDGVIGGFTVLNAKMGYQLSKSLCTTLQVKNLLDADAASPPQDTSINTPIPYRGREASVGVTYTF
jgi:outer membrane receptor for ferrienterochelin and colicins